MAGPCMCGDIYCASCGDPGLAEVEAAEEWLIDQLDEMKLSVQEYKIVATVGLEAVRASREAVQHERNQIALGEAESQDHMEAIDYLKQGK